MEDVRSPEVYPRVVAEMVKMHCDIPSNGLAGNHAEEAGMWNKIRTFDALVEEILQTNPTLVARWVVVFKFKIGFINVLEN